MEPEHLTQFLPRGLASGLCGPCAKDCKKFKSTQLPCTALEDGEVDGGMHIPMGFAPHSPLHLEVKGRSVGRFIGQR